MTRTTSPLRVANAPCSWGALEFDWAGPAPAFARVLDEMAATGYSGTELGDWGFMPTAPAALRDELARRNLALLGAFVPVRLSEADAHDDGIAQARRVATLLAAAGGPTALVVLSDATADHPVRTQVAGRVGPEHGLSEAAWRTLSTGADRIARAVRDETGLRTVFHHHCATFVETPREIDELLSRTDPDALGLCLDTGHCAFGGGDPVAVAASWRERIWHVHLKDQDPALAQRSRAEGWDYARAVREGIFCELGRGSVDLSGVLGVLREAGYDGWLVVEQDVLPSMGTPAESAARNRAFLHTLGV
jgi:inosose dehydratase